MGVGLAGMCVQPPLKQVPKGDWLCHRCVRDGINLEDLREARAATRAAEKAQPKVRGKKLFPGVVARRKRQGNQGYNGRVVVNKQGSGSRERVQLGKVRYIPHSGFKCYEILLQDGTVCRMSPVEVRHRLMPEGTAMRAQLCVLCVLPEV